MTGFDPPTVDDLIRKAGRVVAHEVPHFERVLVRLRDRYARTYIALRSAVNHLRYKAPPQPYRLIDVDPQSIEYVNPVEGPKFRHAGVVADGTWDLTERRFDETDVYDAYQQHFKEGVPWTETAFYDRVIAEIDLGDEPWGCGSAAEFQARCERLDRLYETIRRDGYYSQNELREASRTDPIKSPSRLKIERYKDEISVNIGRDGEILFADGRNRLSIVKLLDLDRVPVRVLRRHRDWQAIRDGYSLGRPVPDCLLNHPDLRGLRDR